MIWGTHVPYWHVNAFGEWLNFWPLDMTEPPSAYVLMLLEAACREEIRSRGLPWQEESVHGGWCDGGFKARIAGEWQYASTPAHALLLALIAALEAE